MSTLDSIRKDTLNFLKKRGVSQVSDAALDAAPDVAVRSLDAAPVAVALPAPRRFSVFNPVDEQRAADLVTLFMSVADQLGGDAGLQAVVQVAAAAEASHGLELVKYALSVFIVHHPEGRKLPLPRLWEREPDLFARQPAQFRALPEMEMTIAADQPVDESVLAWYREDPFQNEHHEHWHIVYPGGGVRGRLKDRQGELFLYMHEQMLARYNTERLAAGLEIVAPFDVYTDPIPEGYDSGLPGYTPREPNQSLQDIPRFPTLSTLDDWRDRLRTAVEEGVFALADGESRPVEPDPLGDTVEANIGSVNNRFYGSLHNTGHGVIASAMGPGTFGVMTNTATAIMDPIFYRWHRHIDDFSYRHQEMLPVNDFSDAPNVLIRNKLPGPVQEFHVTTSQSPDIMLVFASQLPQDVDLNEYGQETFGGEHWHQDFSDSGQTTNELTTKFETRQFVPEESEQGLDGLPIEITYLEQDEFVYFIRLENQEAREQTVTVRIWLVAKDQAEDRRMWIEMDTFETTLAASARKVIYRPAKFSSVIKKENGEGQKPPTLITPPGTNDPSRSPDYCDCGWPYNLLLPKGTEEGMEFRLMVICTGNDIDMQGAQHSCGSVSLCGTRADRFPDKRPMGYPFNRRFTEGQTIEETIFRQSNMAARDIVIRFDPSVADIRNDD